jgi:copper(I)-binding protein
MVRINLLALLVAATAACSPNAPKISAHDAWAREPGAADMAAAYVTIDNKGGADRLTNVRSTMGEATLHETSMDNGVMRMRPIDPEQGLSVPSNGKLQLAPGGAHVMIMGLKQPLKAGDDFGLTLQFAKSRPERVTVTVRPAAQ